MNVYDTERLDIIKRYEKLKQKYDDREDLRKDFPDAYERICKILKYLKVGYEYTTIFLIMASIIYLLIKLCKIISDTKIWKLLNREIINLNN